MEWFIAFTIIGLYSAQLFLVVSEYLNPSPVVPISTFQSVSAGLISPEIHRRILELKKRNSGEKVNWKQEGF